MNERERFLAVLKYENYDRIPVLHFGFWPETLEKWCAEGHITQEEANSWGDANLMDQSIGKKLGFDGNYYTTFQPPAGLFPYFEPEVIEELPDGTKKVLDYEGAIILQKNGAGSIPAEVGHTLQDRKSWEEIYLPRLQFTEDRINTTLVFAKGRTISFSEGGKEELQRNDREYPIGLHCGSFFGVIRNWLGIQGLSYLQIDDPQLYDEIIDTVANLSYRIIKLVLESGAKFDFAHFWEDICFKNGPLVNPKVFDDKIGPHYNRITKLMRNYGINIVSLDCDGLIDMLIPTWFNNGVNTMFPIEVGTWNASIKPWRDKYGRKLRGVGGVRKHVFSEDMAAIDGEIERLKPLVDIGGYIPCPDHRIPPNSKWDNIRYFCSRMRETFS